MIKVNGWEVQDKRFPDNTFNLTGDAVTFLHNYYTPHTADPDTEYREHVKTVEGHGDGEGCFHITWKYEKPEELFVIQMLVAHMRDKMGAQQIHLFMPYIPNARMDRTHQPMSEVNVLKYFCQLINDLGFHSVTVCDAHSDAAINQLDRVIQFPMKEFVLSVVAGSFGPTDGYDYLFFPDDGAFKRYGQMYNFRTPMYGKKVRNWHTGVIERLDLENPCGIKPGDIGEKRILIVDDICSRGGTFMHAGIKLKEFGFKHIGLCVTHLENTVFAGSLLKSDSPIEKIYTTDSLKHAEHDKIFTLPMGAD